MILAPTVSYRNRVLLTEAITPALEVRDQKMVCGSVDEPFAESPSTPRAWAFSTALGIVVGLLAFGLVVNEPVPGASALQLYLSGTLPGFGEKHYASASDRSPRASTESTFIAHGPFPGENREETRQILVDEWRQFEESFSCGVQFSVARWVACFPVRVSIGVVGGNRVLVLAPGLALWQTWCSVADYRSNGQLACLAAADERKSRVESSAQRVM